VRRLLLVLMLATLAAEVGGAQTAPPASPAPAPPANAARVTLGDVTVLQFRVGSGGFTPEQRASKLQDRVVEILSRPDLGPKDVRVTPGKGGRSATITVGPLLFVTVTEADARATRSTPEKLAATWAANFRKGYEAAQPKPIRPQ
jgi:hypothetical protein